MNNFHWILSFAFLFSLANLQAQEENNGAILLDPESGQALCRIGGQVGQDFIPQSLVDEIGQIQDLEECNDQQILAAAIEGETENMQMANPSPLSLFIVGATSTLIGGCLLGAIVKLESTFSNAKSNIGTPRLHFEPKNKTFLFYLSSSVAFGTGIAIYAKSKIPLLGAIISASTSGIVCREIIQFSPEEQDGQ